MVRRLDLERWRRRDHFAFFRDFEQPFWNVTTEVDVTALAEATADTPSGFFLGSLYLTLEAANATEPFRYRIRGDEVVVHDVIHGGSTVLRDDETFGFGYFDYRKLFADFAAAGRIELDRAKRSTGLEDRDYRDDYIYFSVLPWIRFTSFTHARNVPATDSAPRIVFGKRTKAEDGKVLLPVSVEAHHALVDGQDVARFLDRFQSLLVDPMALGKAS